MAPLSLTLLQKAQAEVEGFQNGPLPALNPANLNTQDALGNTQVPTTSSVPYYPSSETPNLQLSTEDMSSKLANNMVILDTFAATSVPVIQGSLQKINVNTAQSVSITSATDQMYAVSLYLDGNGDGLVTDLLVATLSWLDTSVVPDVHSASIQIVGNSLEIATTTYALLVKGGTTVTCSTAFSASPFHYDISVRLVRMP